METKKHYMITLTLRSGDVEKQCLTLIEASSEDEAKKVALFVEIHCDYGHGAYLEHGGMYDHFGEWFYFVRKVQEIKKESLPVLLEYFNVFRDTDCDCQL